MLDDGRTGRQTDRQESDIYKDGLMTDATTPYARGWSNRRLSFQIINFRAML